jgi:CRISPR-associated protein Csb2
VRGYLSSTRRFHSEILFRHPVQGPLVVGRGRFAGFGLMMPWQP